MQLKPKPKLVLYGALELEWPCRVVHVEARGQCCAAILKGKSRQHLVSTIMSGFFEWMNVSPNLRFSYVFFLSLTTMAWKFHINYKVILKVINYSENFSLIPEAKLYFYWNSFIATFTLFLCEISKICDYIFLMWHLYLVLLSYICTICNLEEYPYHFFIST